MLDAERSLFNAQLSYVQNQGVLFQAVIDLYKAMGGGWVLEAEKETVLPSGGIEGLRVRGWKVTRMTERRIR